MRIIQMDDTGNINKRAVRSRWAKGGRDPSGRSRWFPRERNYMVAEAGLSAGFSSVRLTYHVTCTCNPVQGNRCPLVTLHDSFL